MDEGLPDMTSRLANDVDSVLAGHVQRRQNSVSALLAKNLDERLARCLRESSLGSFFVFFDFGLATDTRDFEQELSHKGDGRLLYRQ